jgi:sterol desaturase/sphingolipid hydroxylase (fatty acid hydroxylase superfamily)
MFKESLLILITTPIYALIIGIEMLISTWHNRELYTTKDTLTNVCLTVLNGGLDILLRGVNLVIFLFFANYSFIHWDQSSWVYWSLLFLGEDFAYYWLHRIDHHVRFFWAVHVTHHSSEKFNLTTGFRSSVFQPLYRAAYFIPLVLLGFAPLDILLMYSITQIYGILVHTQLIDKMGFLEYILVTPSHHRVHHASNIPYLDKNLGQALIIWDRLLGTFEEENVEKHGPTVYSLTTKLEEKGIVHTIFHEWMDIIKDIRQKDISFWTKLKYLFNPPGWSHDGSRATSVELQENYYNSKKN